MNDTPVLFLIFNRLDLTKQVFSAIRKYKPSRLYVAADGPRFDNSTDLVRCAGVREYILQSIDWPCELKTLFRNTNLGCGKAPSEAITWFFENEEEGIILEDDCLPNQSFFLFCQNLLSKYRYNQTVSAISGNNFQLHQPMPVRSDYYFSIFPSSWGWATWRRAWNGFDFSLSSWKNYSNDSTLKFIFNEKPYRLWWKHRFDWMHTEQPQDMWDFQFHYHSMINRRLAIIPKANLVSNIGHESAGTHFQDPNSRIASLPTYELNFPLQHPSTIVRNYEADVYIQNLLFGNIEVVSPFVQLKRFFKQIAR